MARVEPAAGTETRSLYSGDRFIIPTKLERFALHGTERLSIDRLVELRKRSPEPMAAILGILLTDLNYQFVDAAERGAENATLVGDDLEGAIRELKAERDGEIEVAGPDLAHSLTELGLIDEYRIYLHPVVPGHGKPWFAEPRPPLRLVANDRIGEDVIRLTYVPA